MVQNKQAEKEFFDQFSDRDYDVFGRRGYRRLMGCFDRMAEPRAGDRVIDVGCGTGVFAQYLSAFGLEVTGVDISEKCIQYAARKYPGMKFMAADAESTGLPAGSYDIVFLSGMLHHFPQPGGCLRESFRLLKPGGRLFGFDPNGRNPAMALYRDERSPFFSSKGKTPNEILLKREDIADALRDAGFTAVEIRAVSGITFKYIESGLMRRLLFLYNLFEVLFGLLPFAGAYGSFLVYGAKKT